jgi:hypothetical protein
MAPSTRAKVAEMDKSELELLIVKAVESATKSITEDLRALKEEVSSLKEELVAKDFKIRHLETTVDDLEQYGRRNNLRIFGIPERDNEKTDDIVIDVASKIGVVLDSSCIDRSHRVGKKGTHHRPIIVKFTSYAHRRSVFSQKKLLKGTKITVREDLTKSRLNLMKNAVSAYSEKRVWSIDGVIKINAGLRYPLSIHTDEQLNTVLSKHPPDLLQ